MSLLFYYEEMVAGLFVFISLMGLLYVTVGGGDLEAISGCGIIRGGVVGVSTVVMVVMTVEVACLPQ